MAKEIGPTKLEIVSDFLKSKNGMIGLLEVWVSRYGDTFNFQIGGRRFFYFRHPDAVKEILATPPQKLEMANDNMERFLGQGLLVAKGEVWKSHRRHLQPMFQAKIVERFLPLVDQEATELADRWDSLLTKGDSFEFAADPEFLRITLSITTKAFFSHSAPSKVLAELNHHFLILMEECVRDLKNPIALPKTWPTPRKFRVDRALQDLNKLLNEIIAQRRIDIQTGEPPKDFLSSMILGKDPETGEFFSDSAIRDEVVTFMGAGHETTALNLTWTSYLLGRHPEIQKRFREALSEKTEAYPDFFSHVFNESLRLYPPAWAFQRRAMTDLEIQGVAIPKESRVLVCPFLTHRHPDFWPKAEMFDPSRFQQGDFQKGAYFPFGLGMRNCIGQHFAKLVVFRIFTVLSQRFQLKTLGKPPFFEPLLTLRPRKNVLIEVTRAV